MFAFVLLYNYITLKILQNLPLYSYNMPRLIIFDLSCAYNDLKILQYVPSCAYKGPFFIFFVPLYNCIALKIIKNLFSCAYKSTFGQEKGTFPWAKHPICTFSLHLTRTKPQKRSKSGPSKCTKRHLETNSWLYKRTKAQICLRKGQSTRTKALTFSFLSFRARTKL